MSEGNLVDIETLELTYEELVSMGIAQKPFPELLPKEGDLRIAEIGVYRGISMRHMLDNVPNIVLAVGVDPYWGRGHIYTEDRPSVENWYLARRNLKEYIGNKLSLINDTSAHASLLFADGYFDYVFIDGDHSYDAVREDIKLWLPKVKVGGILAGHDYHDGYPYLVRAVGDSGIKHEGVSPRCWMHRVENE